MADDYGVDLHEIERVIERAEVLVIRFDVLEKRLLVDFRTEEAGGPLVALVDRVSSVEERFRRLKALRPRLPLPSRILSFLWPRGVRAFEEAGVWDRLRERLVSLGADADELGAVRRALDDEERAVLAAAIRGGEGFQTVWERET